MKKIVIIVTIIVFMGLAGCNKVSKKIPFIKKNSPAPLAIKKELNVKKNWVVRASRGSQGKFLQFKPTIADDQIFITDYLGNVFALQINNGHFVWKENVKEPAVTSPAYGNDKIFFATENANLYAVSAAKGKTIWTAKLPAQAVNTPAYGADLVVVKTLNGKVIAYNTENGDKRWEYQEEVPRLMLRQSSPPIVEYPLVISGFSNGKIVALTADKGKLVWEQTIARPLGFSEIKRMTDVVGNLEIDNGIIYAASYHGNVTAININNGHILWNKALSTKSGLAVSHRHVYVTDSRGRIWALNKNNGEVIWRQNELQDHFITAPAVIDNYIVVADNDGSIYWMGEEDGRFVAAERLSKTGILAKPEVYNGRLYALSKNGTLISLMPKTVS